MKDYKCECGHLHSEHNCKKYPNYSYELLYGCCLAQWCKSTTPTICGCTKFQRMKDE